MRPTCPGCPQHGGGVEAVPGSYDPRTDRLTYVIRSRCGACGSPREVVSVRTAADYADECLRETDLPCWLIAENLRRLRVPEARIGALLPSERVPVGEPGESEQRAIYGERWEGGRVPGIDPAPVGGD